jgi:hypothetical protein
VAIDLSIVIIIYCYQEWLLRQWAIQDFAPRALYQHLLHFYLGLLKKQVHLAGL